MSVTCLEQVVASLDAIEAAVAGLQPSLPEMQSFTPRLRQNSADVPINIQFARWMTLAKESDGHDIVYVVVRIAATSPSTGAGVYRLVDLPHDPWEMGTNRVPLGSSQYFDSSSSNSLVGNAVWDQIGVHTILDARNAAAGDDPSFAIDSGDILMYSLVYAIEVT